MSRAFQKIMEEVSMMVYEKMDNNPDDFRFNKEELPEMKRKIRYIEMHQKDSVNSGLDKEVIDCKAAKACGYYKMKKYDMAEELFLEIKDMAIENKDEMRLRQALTNLGLLNKLKGKFGAAMQCYNEALELAEKRAERWCQARLLNNLGNMYELQAHYDKAIDMHLQRLEIARELLDRDGEAKACATLGALYHLQGDIEKSIQYYEDVQNVLRLKLSK